MAKEREPTNEKLNSKEEVTLNKKENNTSEQTDIITSEQEHTNVITPELLKAMRDKIAEQNKDKQEFEKITIEELKKRISDFNEGKSVNFNVNWSELVKDKDFTEDMVYMFQNHIQLYFKDYIDTHKDINLSLLKSMYWDMVGVFNLEWVDTETGKKILGTN